MGKQAVIARLEGGRQAPEPDLERFAKATGTRLRAQTLL